MLQKSIASAQDVVQAPLLFCSHLRRILEN
jgi:hypothetical protein